MGTPSAIQFLWGRNDAIVADSSAGTVNLLQNVSATLQNLAVVRQGDGPAHPDLVAVDRFSQRVVAAQRGANSGISVDLSSGITQSFTCGCTISTLEPLIGTSIYRISDFAEGRFTTSSVGDAGTRVQEIALLSGVRPAGPQRGR
jgi:hypothetical protein